QPGPAFATGAGAVLPMTARLADPLGRVGKLALIAWTGAPGAARPATGTRPPEPERGDDPVKAFALRVTGGDGPPGGDRTAEGELLLPPVPRGKVLWVRPRYGDADGTERWGEAVSLGAPSPPVERESAALNFHPHFAGQVTLRSHALEKVE